MKTAESKRIAYLDIARGTTMLLTIAFHVLGETFLPFHHFVASMCLTVFFFVSGYFFNGFHWRNVLQKLVIPYWIVLAAVRILWSIRTRKWRAAYIGRLLLQMFLGRTIDSMWPGQAKYVGIIWFLPLLACARLVYMGICRITGERVQIRGILCLLCSLIGVSIGDRGIRLPWSLDAALAAIPFMWMGEAARLYQRDRKRILSNPLSLGVLFAGWAFLTYFAGYSELAMRKYPYGLLWLVISAASTLFTIGISMQIDRHLKYPAAMLAWCGRYSMVLLIAHVMDKSCMTYPKGFPIGIQLVMEMLWALLPVLIWYVFCRIHVKRVTE